MPGVEHTTRLIVNADDFGRSPGICAGIEEAHRRGIVTSTTALMNSPGVAEALRTLHERCPALGLGVHLNLTLGRPLLGERVSSLTRSDGTFHPLETFLAASFEMHLHEVRAELQAQIEAFLATGVPLDHLDCHQHVVVLCPPFFQIFLDLAAGHEVPIRQPIPDSARPEAAARRSGTSWEAVLPFLRFGLRHPYKAFRLLGQVWDVWSTARGLTEVRGVMAPDRFIDAFYDQDATLDNLLAIIDRLPPGTSELLCHPGHVDDALRAQGDYVEPRAQELRILTDPAIRERLEQRHVELVTFAALTR